MRCAERLFMLRMKIVAVGTITVLATAPALTAQDFAGGHPASEVASAVPSESLRRSIASEVARLAESRVRVASPEVQTQPGRSWIGRHPVLTGALVGAGGGAVWADIFCRGQCEGDPRLYMAFFGGIGAGVGAGIGAVFDAIRR